MYIGEYKYTIHETVPVDRKGVAYDGTTYNVTVTVEYGTGDNAGKLVSTVKYGTKAAPTVASEGSLTIENNYNAKGHNNFNGTKTLEGREYKAEDSFSFTITPVGNAPLRRMEGGAKQASVTVMTAATTDGKTAGIAYGDFYFVYEELCL